MDDDWESVADKEVVIRPAETANINKWRGEDDEDEVKESWEDEEEKKDEEKSTSSSTKAAPIKTKPNKTLKAILAEQERLAELEEAERLASMTPEEKLAEKLRLQKIQEESDLKSALETFGVTTIASSAENINPESKEEFQEYGATLSWKLSQYKESPHFPQFVEDLVRSICVNLSAADMKKVKISLETLHTEKLKLEKQNTKKPAGKGKGKATLRKETDDIEVYQKYGSDFNDDYDDFM